MSVEAALTAHPALGEACPEPCPERSRRESRRVKGGAARSSKQWYKDLWEHDPAIHHLLQASESLEVARQKLFNYLKDLEWKYRCGQLDSAQQCCDHKLEWATAMEALEVFYNILSPRNEEIAGFETLAYLWRLAREDERDQPRIR
jgi:hypothetical protein